MNKLPEFKLIVFGNKGYTLIELLAVILVLVSVGAIITAIITASLRGSQRSSNVNEVRQEGNFALTQMSKMIRYAKSFEGVSLDGASYDTDCTVNTAITPTPTITQYKYIKIKSFDDTDTVFSCSTTTLSDNSVVDTIASNSANLVSVDKVAVNGCYFICSQQNSNLSPVIDINFTLSPFKQGFVENTLSIPFQTSVIFRNVGD